MLNGSRSVRHWSSSLVKRCRGGEATSPRLAYSTVGVTTRASQGPKTADRGSLGGPGHTARDNREGAGAAEAFGRSRRDPEWKPPHEEGDHLCQHSEHVANHVDSVAPSVPAPLKERRTSSLPQRGQTSPMADEITSRSRIVRPFQLSEIRQLPGLGGLSERRRRGGHVGALALARSSAPWLGRWHRRRSAHRGPCY